MPIARSPQSSSANAGDKPTGQHCRHHEYLISLNDTFLEINFKILLLSQHGRQLNSTEFVLDPSGILVKCFEKTNREANEEANKDSRKVLKILVIYSIMTMVVILAPYRRLSKSLTIHRGDGCFCPASGWPSGYGVQSPVHSGQKVKNEWNPILKETFPLGASEISSVGTYRKHYL